MHALFFDLCIHVDQGLNVDGIEDSSLLFVLQPFRHDAYHCSVEFNDLPVTVRDRRSEHSVQSVTISHTRDRKFGTQGT